MILAQEFFSLQLYKRSLFVLVAAFLSSLAIFLFVLSCLVGRPDACIYTGLFRAGVLSLFLHRLLGKALLMLRQGSERIR